MKQKMEKFPPTFRNNCQGLEKGDGSELLPHLRSGGYACTQRVVQFEVTDFTGVPSSGRFV